MSLDIILLSESQLIIKGDRYDEGNYQVLNSNFKSNHLKYVAIFNSFFRYPIYGILTKDFEFKVIINQQFKEKNDYNLKNLLISIFEFVSDVLMSELYKNEEIKLFIYMKRKHFETESKLLIKNLNWLGGKLILDDKDQTNKFNDWFIMEFEV